MLVSGVKWKVVERRLNQEQTIRHSKAVLVFNVLRSGLHPPGTQGSGIIVARLPDGSWSPPSAVLIQAPEWDFVKDADIYDCLCIINNGVENFMSPRCTLGQDIHTTIGPVGGGETADKAIKEREFAPCWTWVKGKTEWSHQSIDGTIVFQRIGENEKFYGVDGVQPSQILKGEVHAPSGPLMEVREVLEACEKQDWNRRKLPKSGSPGDFNVKPPTAESLKEYEARQESNNTDSGAAVQ